MTDRRSVVVVAAWLVTMASGALSLTAFLRLLTALPAVLAHPEHHQPNQGLADFIQFALFAFISVVAGRYANHNTGKEWR